MSKREKLAPYTERAIRATEAGKLIPPIVYLPRTLRSKPTLLTENNCALTVEPPTMKDNVIRMQEADPLGFLIAVMNGQPIPEFRITAHGSVELFYVCPRLQERMRAAEYMANRGGLRGMKLGAMKGGATGNTPDEHDPDHEALLARVGGGSDGERNQYGAENHMQPGDK